MKILHLSCMRELTSGQRKQLVFEYEASKKLGLDWSIIALHNGKIEDKRFELNIPNLFKPIFLRNFYAWLYMLKHQNNYDAIVNRHMSFDPFVLVFGWFIKNRFSVHHAKEIEELKSIKECWKGKVSSYVERFTGFISLQQLKGVICVTEDIAQYQKNRVNNKIFFYPNGIDLSLVKLAKDKRISGEINIAFMCGTFSAWHGLDLLLKSVLENQEVIKKNNVKIHLIGLVLEKELDFIKINKLDINLYGLLNAEKYIRILESCDIGLDSLALDRKNLSEAAALKTREYLAYGLSIFSAYKDTAIPLDFKYYKVGSPDIKDMITYAKENKKVSREKVRESSEEFISKEILLKKLYEELEEFYYKK